MINGKLTVYQIFFIEIESGEFENVPCNECINLKLKKICIKICFKAYNMNEFTCDLNDNHMTNLQDNNSVNDLFLLP